MTTHHKLAIGAATNIVMLRRIGVRVFVHGRYFPDPPAPTDPPAWWIAEIERLRPPPGRPGVVPEAPPKPRPALDPDRAWLPITERAERWNRGWITLWLLSSIVGVGTYVGRLLWAYCFGH